MNSYGLVNEEPVARSRYLLTEVLRDRLGVDGPGVLAARQSDDPRSTESFTASGRTTFDGRALAVIRPTGVGEITVSVTADGLDGEQIIVTAS